MATSLLSRAGLLLYRQLPEEYRYRDTDPGPGELGDLEAYLHGHGALLDLMRNTLEQLYADGFAEPVDAGGPTPAARQIQPWLLPYLAELVGADLKAPDPEARTRELARSVGWYKAKGTLGAIDSIADVVANAETYIVEGWQRTLITPRQALAPFTMDPADVGDGDPMGPPPIPLGTVDVRRHNRAVLDPAGGNSLMTLCLPRRDALGGPLPTRDAQGRCIAPRFWRQSARTGAPCFPGAFDDSALRTPDLRDPARAADVGPNPRRILAYVQPPYGFFSPGLLRLTATGADPLGLATATDPIGARDAARILQAPNTPISPTLDRVEINGDLTIPAGTEIILRDLLVLGTITIEAGARLILERCAARAVVLPATAPEPSLDARHCLFEDIGVTPPRGFARLEHVTVLGRMRAWKLQASDCIFAGSVNSDICGAGRGTCIRYSRIPPLLSDIDCGLGRGQHNTAAEALFLPRPTHMPPPTPCVVRQPAFGEPGAGVLSHQAPQSVRAGAERGGEMGAYNHLAPAASLDALALKLADFQPLGQELAIVYEARMALAPPELKP